MVLSLCIISTRLVQAWISVPRYFQPCERRHRVLQGHVSRNTAATMEKFWFRDEVRRFVKWEDSLKYYISRIRIFLLLPSSPFSSIFNIREETRAIWNFSFERRILFELYLLIYTSWESLIPLIFRSSFEVEIKKNQLNIIISISWNENNLIISTSPVIFSNRDIA